MRTFIKDKIIRTTAENQIFTQTGAEPSPSKYKIHIFLTIKYLVMNIILLYIEMP